MKITSLARSNFHSVSEPTPKFLQMKLGYLIIQVKQNPVEETMMGHLSLK